MKSQVWKHVAVGAVCLAVGAAGTAGASSLITGKSIKDGTIEAKDLSKKARKALTGKTGPRGKTGATGPGGAAGAPGAPGAPGAGTSMLMLGSSSVPHAGELFASPIGTGGAAAEDGLLTPIPAGATLTATALTAHVRIAPGAGESIVLTLRVNSADTPLACTIADAATTCQLSGAAVSLAAGSTMTMHVVGSAAPASSAILWDVRVTP